MSHAEGDRTKELAIRLQNRMRSILEWLGIDLRLLKSASSRKPFCATRTGWNHFPCFPSRMIRSTSIGILWRDKRLLTVTQRISLGLSEIKRNRCSCSRPGPQIPTKRPASLLALIPIPNQSETENRNDREAAARIGQSALDRICSPACSSVWGHSVPRPIEPQDR